MHINNISTKIFTQNINNKRNTPEPKNQILQNENEQFTKYPAIAFKALYNVKQKTLDTEAETKKLLKQLNEILASDMDLDELMHLYERQIMAQMLQKTQKAENLLKESEELVNSHTLSDIQKAERLLSIEKQFNSIEKNMFKFKPFEPPKPLDANIDTALINRFKNAILEENFNLDKVYFDYYSELENIKTVEELNNKYPKINIPDNPEYVIADKIVSALTRDFFEHLDKLVRKKDKDKIYEFINAKVQEIIKQSVKNPQDIYNKVFQATAINILMKYDKLQKTNTFSSVPEFRKNKSVQITENDLKLLSVDFNDFVLTAFREQYLGMKKPGEIKYTAGDVTISVGALKENSYKFEKISEKIKAILNTARKIKSAKRDYESFDENKLHERLNFYAGTEIGNNEKIFERIVDFDSCAFSKEDKEMLIKFLKELDSIKDEEKSIEDALKTIEAENLKPKEPKVVDDVEKNQVVETLRNQQRKAFELKTLKNRFDSVINALYLNDLSGSATTFSKYRPENLEADTIKNVEYVTNLATEENLKHNRPLIKAKIRNWDTFNYYKDNEKDSDIFVAALTFAKDKDGHVDVNKAGMYLVNAETVMNVPHSLEYVSNKELFENIISRASSQEEAIKYLCKYEEYNELRDDEKSHLLNYIDNFSLKDNVEKFILKNIIENDYVNSDTVSHAGLKDGEKVEATITSNAKMQILDKYKFPGCLEFMTGFEDALTSFATERGSSGIKKTGSNNKALEYKLELKLMGHDDRLFSVENNYYFDVFSDKGLH